MVPSYKIAEAYFEQIEAFKQYSSHNIDFLPCIPYHELSISLEPYDVIIIHYGLCLYNEEILISKENRKKIAEFPGLKIYFGQDEYTTPTFAVERLKEFGIHHIFSIISSKIAFRKVYPKSALPNLSFDTVFTGYVSEKLASINLIPLEKRSLDIAYRGNSLGLVYGSLGAEKFEIGMQMKEYAKKNNLKADIEWTHQAKVFGKNWLEFLQSSRVTLCTESGSSIIHSKVGIKSTLNPTMKLCADSKTVEEFRKRAKQYYKLLPDDGKYVISGISPKVFEAIACGTVLVCYEGYFSGVIKPNIHYISLKKDYSNISEVITKIRDIKFLRKMQQRAYKDVVLSGKYSYEAFIKKVDKRIIELFKTLKLKRKDQRPSNAKYKSIVKMCVGYHNIKSNFIKTVLLYPLQTTRYLCYTLTRRLKRYIGKFQIFN
jgi:hypothetical protein